MPKDSANPADLTDAARNLLFSCGDYAPGEHVTIVQEDPETGWYAAGLAEALAEEGRKLGLDIELQTAPAPDLPQPEAVTETIASPASIVYFARLGDQDRFGETGSRGRRVMVYARSLDALASPFGRVPHPVMRRFKEAVDREIFAAGTVRITCPAGTEITGHAPAGAGKPADTTVRRFPLGVGAPVPGAHFTGRVALKDSLTPTGNRAYDPPVVLLSGVVFAEVADGRITGFTGPAEDVALVEAHYARVANHFDIDPFVVHSWHAGLHPSCPFYAPEGTDRDLWSNAVFSNPKLLHFHTCGTHAPGEIAWNIVDPSVTLDGVALWQDGTLKPRAFPALAAILAEEPSLDALFD